MDERQSVLLYREMLTNLKRAQHMLRHPGADPHAINHEINCVIKKIELILRNLKA